MARRTTPEQPRRHGYVAASDLPGAIDALRSRLKEIQATQPPADPIRDALRQDASRLVTKAQATFRRVFGEDTVECDRTRSWSNYYFSFPSADDYGLLDWDECVKIFETDRGQIAAQFQTQIELLEEQLSLVPSAALKTAVSQPINATKQDIFVVHGHDSAAKNEVVLLLTRAGLTPIVLHEQPNGGRTIIEKFEAHAGAAGFAVVLLTPDDEGGPVGGPMQPRARQNVLGEMFWFAGRLGRKNLCALRKGNVEIPTDFSGITYTDMDDRGAWRSEMLRELAAAGYPVDWQRALV